MRRQIILIFITQLLVVCGVSANAQEKKADEKKADVEVAKLIEQLDSASFNKREAATRALVDKGSDVVAAVAKAAEGDALEVTIRCIQVLAELSVGGNAESGVKATKALLELTKSKKFVVAVRARRAIGSQERIVTKKLTDIKAKLFTQNGQIVRVNFNKDTTTNDHLALITYLPKVAMVSIAFTKVDEKGIKHLAGLKNLTYLNCYGSTVGDAALLETLKLPGLTALPLGETKVTDKGLTTLGKHVRLTYTGFRKMPISDKGVAEMQNMLNLSTLFLGETNVTDACLVHVAKMTRLTTLRLHKTSVTDAGLKRLYGLKKLKEISLYGSKVTPLGITNLEIAIPGIRVISVEPKQRKVRKPQPK
jgi:hypothetical protein